MGRGSHKKEIHVEYPQNTHISWTASIEDEVRRSSYELDCGNRERG
jgi:hypothetical protein